MTASVAHVTNLTPPGECRQPYAAAVLNLQCVACGKPCRSETEKDIHTKRTGGAGTLHAHARHSTVKARSIDDSQYAYGPRR
jgi:hypothetical protein